MRNHLQTIRNGPTTIQHTLNIAASLFGDGNSGFNLLQRFISEFLGEYISDFQLTPNIDEEIFLDVIEKYFCEASHRHNHSHSLTPNHSHSHSHSNSHSHVFYYLGIGGLRPPYKYMIKYMAVAVAVAVSGGVAVPVAVPVVGLAYDLLITSKKIS